MSSIKKYVPLIPKAIVLVFAEIYAWIARNSLNKRNIWIFSEKKVEARDNGYHFFKYICETHPEIEAYYVIAPNAADEPKVKQIGKVIKYDSFRHCVFYYAAKYRVCSQIHGVRPFEEASMLVNHLSFYRRKDQRQINLKHGISKDFRDAFDFRKVGYDLYIAGAKPEYDYIRENFHYPDKNIALTGFCRFDALHHIAAAEKVILVMPTFRAWLRTSNSAKDRASEEESIAFKRSDYYLCYSELLKNQELRKAVRGNGYKIIFYLHYTFQPYTFLFRELMDEMDCQDVIIAGRSDYDVQDLLKRSAVLVTDYSSVFFDFGYMHKPIIYFQFDIRKYREKHYQQGYFEYERDGFGPVCNDSNEVVQYLEKLFNSNMKMETQYLQRINRFFIPYDDQNCKRVYEAIQRLDE